MVAKLGLNLSLLFVLMQQVHTTYEDILTNYEEPVTDILLGMVPEDFQSQADEDSEDASDYDDYDYIEDLENKKVKRDRTMCKKRGKSMTFAAPRFKKPEQMANFVGGSIGHRMELKCLHRKGCPRDLEGGDYYRKVGEAKLPVLWMSPESVFQGRCTTYSDIWSYGVLLWEIVTWGERPYSGVATEKLLDMIKEGYRMPRPPHCPEIFYQLMTDCWLLESTNRPQWSSLVDSLHDLYNSTLPGTYLRLISPKVITPAPSPAPQSYNRQVNNSFGFSVPNPNQQTNRRRVSEESGYMGSSLGALNESILNYPTFD